MNIGLLPKPWLKTERLTLREFSQADRYAIVEMHKDPRVRALLVDDYPLDSHVVVEKLIENLQKCYRKHEGLGIWCAEQFTPVLSPSDIELAEVREFLSSAKIEELSRPTPLFAGWFNLMPMLDAPDEIELGSRLLPEFWGKGFALEGGERLLEHAFTSLNREKVMAIAHVEHRAVRYCLMALGFDDDGIRNYDGNPAQYYVIHKEHWMHWHSLNRRLKQRHAVKICKDVK